MTSRRSTAVSIALAATSVAAALSFSRVFRYGSFAPALLGAAVLPHAIGALGRKRRWPGPVTLVLGAVGLLVWAAWTTALRSTSFGAPGWGAVQQLARNLENGWQIYRTGRAPIPVSAGVVLLVVSLTWLVATAADRLAFSHDASIGALVPALLAFVVASTVGTPGLRTVTTLAFAAASAVFLMVQHEALLERRRTWFTGRQLAGSAALGAGITAGVVAIVVGLVLAPALPGAGAGPLLDYRHLAGGTGAGAAAYESTANPLVDLRSRLTTQSDAELFTVQLQDPRRLYWRLVALDEFDGTTWTLHSRGERAQGSLVPGRGTVTQHFTIEALGDRWVPAAYEPVHIDLPDAEVVPESLTLVAAQDSVVGLSYTVRSRVPRVPSASAAVIAPTPPTIRRYTELPGNFPDDVAQLALQVTAGAPTPYDKAKALERFFTTSGGFTYKLDIPPAGRDPLHEFLRDRVGFCQQFAATYAAMARAIGLPARVAVGFTAGTYDPDIEAFRVTGRYAHAWAEVWLPGPGWTAFEPTPAGAAPGQADTAVGGPPTSGPVAEGPATPSVTTQTTAPSVATAPTSPRRSGDGAISVAPPPRSPRRGQDDTAAWALLAVVGTGLVVSGMTYAGSVLYRRARRRARRRGASEPLVAIVGAWEEAVDRLDEAGCPPLPALTPAEFARIAPRVAGFAETAVPLDALAREVTVALWSPHTPDDADATQVWAEVDSLVTAVKHSLPAPARARRLLFPSSSSPLPDGAERGEDARVSV